jgi:hypothetical protein
MRIEMENSPNSLEKLFSVFTKPQTYLNLIYLFLTFPLGLTYFIILITGLSLGFGLMIIWVGFLVLAAVFALSWAMTLFERQLAIVLLRVDIPRTANRSIPGESIWRQFKRYFGNAQTWKGMAYLFVKFPLGIITFVLSVTLLSISLGLLLAPIIYPFVHINFYYVRIDNLPLAVLGTVVGVFLTPLSLYVLNMTADLWAGITKAMLGETQKEIPPVQPVSPQI